MTTTQLQSMRRLERKMALCRANEKRQTPCCGGGGRKFRRFKCWRRQNLKLNDRWAALFEIQYQENEAKALCPEI